MIFAIFTIGLIYLIATAYVVVKTQRFVGQPSDEAERHWVPLPAFRLEQPPTITAISRPYSGTFTVRRSISSARVIEVSKVVVMEEQELPFRQAGREIVPDFDDDSIPQGSMSVSVIKSKAIH